MFWKKKLSHKERKAVTEKTVGDIERILKIERPARLFFVPILYVAGTGEVIAPESEEYIKNIPDDAGYMMSYYNEASDVMVMCWRAAYCDLDDYHIKIGDVTPADAALCTAHEMRHVWQYRTAKNRYYARNARGLEVIDDIAEIDADAFSIAYFFQDDIPFTVSDLGRPRLQELYSVAFFDGGKRIERAKNLAEHYGFGSTSNIERFVSERDEDLYNKIKVIVNFNRAVRLA